MRGGTAIVCATLLAMGAMGGLGACGLDGAGLLTETGGSDASIPLVDSSLGVSSNGVADGSVEGASPQPDAGEPGGGDDGGGDAGAPDVRDAEPFDACPLPVTASGTVASATRPATSPTIDGNLSDWPCADWISLDQSDGMLVMDDGGGPPVATLFAVEYDSANLYFAYHVADANISGNGTVDSYVNDSVEIYLSGDADPTGVYDAVSHHYVIDHNNLIVDYGPTYESPPQPQFEGPNLPNVTNAVKVVPGGYDVEVAVQGAAIGVASFTAGQTILFDAEVNAGNGVSQTSYSLWALGHHGTCGCTSCCCASPAGDFPLCDPDRFGQLTLH